LVQAAAAATWSLAWLAWLGRVLGGLMG